MFFGLAIAEESQVDRLNFWKDYPDADLNRLAVAQLAQETWHISRKVKWKLGWTKWGFRFFLTSLVPFTITIAFVVFAVVY